jgi:hypothetical protein
VTGARYALVDVLDLAVLLAEASDPEPRRDSDVAQLLQRVQQATILHTDRVSLDELQAWWQDRHQLHERIDKAEAFLANVPTPATPDTPGAHDDQVEPRCTCSADLNTPRNPDCPLHGLGPRRPRTDVPSAAPEPPLPQLGDFDADGHLWTCRQGMRGRPGYGGLLPCECGHKLRQVAELWANAYKSQPPRMVFTPAEPDGVRHHTVRFCANESELCAYLDAHRERQPIAVWRSSSHDQLAVLTVEVRRG